MHIWNTVSKCPLASNTFSQILLTCLLEKSLDNFTFHSGIVLRTDAILHAALASYLYTSSNPCFPRNYWHSSKFPIYFGSTFDDITTFCAQWFPRIPTDDIRQAVIHTFTMYPSIFIWTGTIVSCSISITSPSIVTRITYCTWQCIWNERNVSSFRFYCQKVL